MTSALLVLTASLLGACSSSGQRLVSIPLASPIPAGKSCIVEVVADPVADVLANSTLQALLNSMLTGTGIFAHVVQPGLQADYALRVGVQKCSRVSSTSRVMIGVLAGSNEIAAVVVLRDLATGNVITCFNVEGTSASHPLSNENEFEDALRKAAEEVCMGLRTVAPASTSQALPGQAPTK
jgi:hypothetical protein